MMQLTCIAPPSGDHIAVGRCSGYPDQVRQGLPKTFQSRPNTENTMSKNAKTARLSLDSFKSAAGAASVKDQLHMITGGALSGCHPPKLT